jgi:YHS domain-containing protein
MTSTARVAAAALLALQLGASGSQAQRYMPPTGNPEFQRLKYADSLVSANDRCMVRAERLSPRVRPTYVNGVPMGFCCVSCPAAFGSNPERYLRERRIRVPDLVRPGRPALFDSTLRVAIGHDLFYFSDAGARDAFARNPLRYVRALTDPVNQHRFRPTWRSRHLDYRGRRYWFETDLTFREFRAIPAAYAQRKGA